MKKGDVLTIRLNKKDNVVVALQDLDLGDYLDSENLNVSGSIPAGHKVASCRIKKGEYILKYGQIVGVASTEINAGKHVHTHNVDMSEFSRDYSVGSDAKPTDVLSEKEQATFDGIVRDDGQVATRNYIGVLPSAALYP
jgi:altronate hydrolase